MRKKLLILVLLGGLKANAQVSNLTAQLQSVFWKLPENVQQQITNTYAVYQRACRLSPTFAGVETNTVDGVSVVTTNHVPKTFLVFFTDLMSGEKVARVVAAKCEETQTKIERSAGSDAVSKWSDN